MFARIILVYAVRIAYYHVHYFRRNTSEGKLLFSVFRDYVIHLLMGILCCLSNFDGVKGGKGLKVEKLDVWRWTFDVLGLEV